MSDQSTNSEARGVILSEADIQRAAIEGVLTQADADRLVHWAYDQQFNKRVLPDPPVPPSPEQRKGFNLVTVVYYFGAMLMISACAWFLGDKWDTLGTAGVFATALVYMLVALNLGWWLRKRGYVVGGGLLITVGVCLVPLLTYTVERMTGLWPDEYPGAYGGFYPWIHGSWIVMELVTIGAALIALRYVRFAFLTAPLAFCFWFLSMDVAALLFRQTELYWETRKWVSVVVGLIIMVVGYGIDLSLKKREDTPKSEDLSFWCYLFGLMAFWGGLTSMDSGSEMGKVVYLAINLALMYIGVRIKRATFVVFGALGVYAYLGHLAWRVFEDSVLFPFVLALLGLSMILATVWVQKHMRRVTAHP